MSIAVHGPTYVNDTLVGYVSDPNGRGTLHILFSCLLTLSLCVWSAVHLDLPRQNESDTQYTLRYLKWSLLGLFGPELLIWVAWRQYISARVLTTSIHEAKHGKTPNKAAEQWTLTHSFYVGMGGFAFALEDANSTASPSFIPDVRRLHVTPRGMRLLARCGLLPEISKDDIDDKSKADGTGKLICCGQVAWLLVQCVTRLAVGLPISPLEINTIGHVVCALMVYALWWNKPRWVREPTVLRREWTRPLCAFMFMSSQVSSEKKPQRDVLRNFGVKPELAGMFYVRGAAAAESTASDSDVKEGINPSVTVADPKTSSSSDLPVRRLSDAVTPHGWLTRRTDLLVMKEEIQNESTEHADIAAARERRWRYCCEAIATYPAIRERLKLPERHLEHLKYREAVQLYPQMPESVQRRFRGYSLEDGLGAKDDSNEWVCTAEELVVDRPRNWPGDDLISHVQGHLMGMILWFSSTIYGAIHCAGWNERFPTSIESWFWRSSGAYLIFSGLLWSFLNLLGHVSGSVWLYWYNVLAAERRKRGHMVIFGLSYIGGTLYVVARVYLVVEAFVSLRALPASTYASPSWVLSVPHLG